MGTENQEMIYDLPQPESLTTLSDFVRYWYKPVIKRFKMRADVQNGLALAYRDGQDYENGNIQDVNKPKTLGDGLSTTGWCLSASQALLYDPIFKALLEYRKAKAKLVSIDIRRQFYGKTYNGHKNVWHTAIFVQDGEFTFIIDLTCSQFGNKYVNKDFWGTTTWLETFRSPIDQHQFTDFDGNVINYGLDLTGTKIDYNYGIKKISADNTFSRVLHNMNQFPDVTDMDKQLIAGLLTTDKLNILNSKLANCLVTDEEYSELERLTGVMSDYFDVIDSSEVKYGLLKFPTKQGLQKWFKNFKVLCNQSEDKQTSFLPSFLMVCDTIENAFHTLNVNPDNYNSYPASDNDEHYLVLKFANSCGVDMDNIIVGVRMLLLYGMDIKLNTDADKIFYNTAELDSTSVGAKLSDTNTFIIELQM